MGREVPWCGQFLAGYSTQHTCWISSGQGPLEAFLAARNRHHMALAELEEPFQAQQAPVVESWSLEKWMNFDGNDGQSLADTEYTRTAEAASS